LDSAKREFILVRGLGPEIKQALAADLASAVASEVSSKLDEVRTLRAELQGARVREQKLQTEVKELQEEVKDVAGRIGGVEIKGETLASEIEPAKELHGMVTSNKAGIGKLQSDIYEIKAYLDAELS
jgi:uncharacterized coiled-coil DUF342 family protein